MGAASDALLTVRAKLCDRIDQIAHELPHLSLQKLAFAIDDVRRIARDHGLTPVVELARGLESALSTSHDQIMVLPYLDSMRDAVGCDRLDEATTQTYLAFVNQRQYG
jgi:hypothetical protein